MIYLYMGVPGSGKSLYACGQILDALSLGKLVITNFPVSFNHIHGKFFQWFYGRGTVCCCSNDQLTPSFLLHASEYYFSGSAVREGRILLVIDECSLIFNPREWNRPDRKEWLSWFSQHRKYGFDVILICQTGMQLDKQLRPIIESRCTFKKISSFLPFSFSFPIFVLCTSYYNSRSKENIKVKVFVYHSKWAKVYNSMRLFNVNG